MSRVIAVANQKGGVAKTTSVVSLGAAFAQRGLRVLLVDLDPQSSLTFSMGIDPDEVDTSVADVLIGDVDVASSTLPAGEGMQVVPATIDLAGVEAMLLPAEGREYKLRLALEEVASSYDVIMLDCSPSLGLLTINALAAADEVLVPMQCEMLSHRGVGQLLDTVADVNRLLNPRLIVRGLLPTMYDGRSVHSRAVLADIAERFDLPVLAPIPRSIRFAEAPGVGGSILLTSRRSAGAKAYQMVADALLRAWQVSRRRASTSKRTVRTAAPDSGNAAAATTAARTTGAKTAAKTSGAKTTGAKTTGAKTTGAKTTAAKSPAAKPTGAKATGAKTTGAKATGAKTIAAKKTAAKRAPKSGGTRAVPQV
jgi:chromosome partitioning protein